MSKAWRKSNAVLIQQAIAMKEEKRRADAKAEDEPKTAVRRKPMPARDPDDARYAMMARLPNPERQEWMDDASKLPKRPPGK